MDLNTIQSDGRWGDVAAFINANFEKIRLELMKLRHASILTFCKGYFSTKSHFLKKYPTGKTGEYAFVGIPWPGTVYEWADTAWVNTGIAPQLGEAVFIEMLKRHIDNETIYWDATDEVIKSAGGGESPVETWLISLGFNFNANEFAKATVTASGDATSLKLSPDGSKYIILVRKGGTVTIDIHPREGYEVERLNVNGVSQGAVDSYTFTNVDKDNTMYLWIMVKEEEQPVDFLERSDLPGTFYSSTHVALNAIKADYPDGLTQDVTLSCVKQAKERRLQQDTAKPTNQRIWLAVLEDWNKGGMHTLTIDGAGMLTYDCASLGGIRLNNVDNILIKSVSFTNFCNYVDAGTPDEIAAVMSVGGNDSFNRNLFITDSSFDGISTSNGKSVATYSVSTKYTENTTVEGCRFSNNGGLTFNMTNSRLTVFSRNKISGLFTTGMALVGHAGLFNVTNGHRLILEDNELDGTSFRESLLYLSGIDSIALKRNYIHGGARIIEMSSNTAIRKLEIESNLIVNTVNNPIFTWIQELFSTSTDVTEVRLANNTMWMGGSNYIQFIIRYTANDVRKAYIYNNIVVDPDASLTSGKVRMYLFDTLGELHSGYNLYKIPIKDVPTGQTYGALTIVQNKNGRDDSITVNGGKSYNLSELLKAGYEVGTRLVNKKEKLLDIEQGGLTYAITEAQDTEYPANDTYVPEFDYDYKMKSASANSRGCCNLKGTLINEAGDDSEGYTGEDLTGEASFNSTAQYTAVADSVLMLTHNTLNRSRFVRFRIEGAQHKSLALGRYALVHAFPEVDAYGEYQTDELYTINID